MTQEYYLRLGQGTLRELGHGVILSITDYRPCARTGTTPNKNSVGL